MNVITMTCCLYLSGRYAYGYRWQLAKRAVDHLAKMAIDYMRSN